MISHTTERFRRAFKHLPWHVQHQAREAYKLFRHNPYHPSLRLKQVHPTRSIYSVRIGMSYRALGVRDGEEIIWFWVGSHGDYDKLLSQL